MWGVAGKLPRHLGFPSSDDPLHLSPEAAARAVVREALASGALVAIALVTLADGREVSKLLPPEYWRTERGYQTLLTGRVNVSDCGLDPTLSPAWALVARDGVAP